MKEAYNSRERKIFHDYNGYSTESLLEMVNNRDNYFPSVIEVITDILSERNVVTPSIEKTKFKPQKEVFLVEERLKADEETKEFVNKLRDKSAADLSDIITKYNNYRFETVKAALIVSVDRGLISYDLKEHLLSQIEKNLAMHVRSGLKSYWEDNNAFLKYVSGYTEEEIYTLIDEPDGVVIDVYHAILLAAKERELISNEDFAEMFRAAKAAIRSEKEIKNQEIEEFFGEDLTDEAIPDELTLKAEMEKYWVCPKCNEMVDMELAVCWNCQTDCPEEVVHPVREEVIRELRIRKPFNFVKAGFGLVGGGIIVGLMGLPVFSTFHHHTHYHRYVAGGFFALLGIFFLIYGLFFNAREDT